MAVVPLDGIEREEIFAFVTRKPSASFAEIGRHVGRCRSTISREVTRNGGRAAYRPGAATNRAAAQRRRPKPGRLGTDNRLRARVIELVKAGNSPWATAMLCARDTTLGRVCHETIYQRIYDGTLGVKPDDCLRSKRRRRKHRNRGVASKASCLGANVVGIAERPDLTGDKSRGSWEGDLIIGARNRSAAITLVEMSSGYQIVYRLGTSYTAERVAEQLARWIETTPAVICRSLTWDRGSEMAGWETLRDGWNLPVYFCDPHSPWQRPKNENSNRQLRFWFPKGTDLARYTQAEFDNACTVLNGQPRRQYNGQTAAERYATNQACTDR